MATEIRSLLENSKKLPAVESKGLRGGGSPLNDAKPLSNGRSEFDVLMFSRSKSTFWLSEVEVGRNEIKKGSGRHSGVTIDNPCNME